MAEQTRDPQREATGGADIAGNRPDVREFLREVLCELEEIPESLSVRMAELIDTDNRAVAIGDLFEELTK